VPYEAGTLKAVGVKDGKVVATVEVSTAGEPAMIALSVDREAIAADRRDVAHITVQIQDANGRMAPTAANEVAFELQGEGKILGLDSGDTASKEDYQSNRRKAFNGLCLAIVQSSGKPGQIRVTASSPGLKPSSVTVTAKG
jgi:beta-galactosidase